MPKSATRLTSPSSLRVPLEAGAVTTALVYTAAEARATLILGHGAGAGQQSAFVVEFARALSARGLDLVTFNFAYTEQGRRIPDRGPVLEACYRSVIDAVRAEVPSARPWLFTGGKSMGGRIATQVAAGNPKGPVAGLVLLGYPLHPPGKPTDRRDKHLPAVGAPMLFIQGSRDAFGTPSELTPILDGLDPRPRVHTVEGGDHSFKLPRKDPAAQAAVHDDIQRIIIEWIDGIAGTAGRAPHR